MREARRRAGDSLRGSRGVELLDPVDGAFQQFEDPETRFFQTGPHSGIPALNHFQSEGFCGCQPVGTEPGVELIEHRNCGGNELVGDFLQRGPVLFPVCLEKLAAETDLCRDGIRKRSRDLEFR